MSKKVIIAGIIILVLSVFFITKSMQAQAHVENQGYDIMLASLLQHKVPELPVDTLENDKDFILLDAREYNEFAVSHIPNAIWAGYNDFTTERFKGVDKNARVLVYCSVGYRSEKITQQLLNTGYTNVSNLYGGIFEWVNEGNSVVDMQDHPTNKVHGYSSKWSIWLFKGEKVYD